MSAPRVSPSSDSPSHEAQERCKRCGCPGPLADSHIVPAAFFRQIQGKGPILLQIGWSEDAHQRKIRKGPYVTDILCPGCDNWLNTVYERQVIRALVHGHGVTSVYFIREDIQSWRFDGVDLDLLKLFLLSVLWRAHITKMGPCKAFNLGSAATRIEEMVLSEDAGGQNEFPTLATRFDYRAAVLFPHRSSLEGVPYWEVSLGDWHFFIKANSEPTPEPYDSCELISDGPRLTLPRDFWGSGHHDLLRDMVIRNRERMARGRARNPT